MSILLRMVGLLLLGFLAMGSIAWGWGWWLAWAMNVGEEHGPTWRAVAIAGMALLNLVAAIGLYRLHDRLASRMDYRVGGRAPRDRLFCQRCGSPAPADQVVCAVCGGTRFGLARSAPAPPVKPAR